MFITFIFNRKCSSFKRLLLVVGLGVFLEIFIYLILRCSLTVLPSLASNSQSSTLPSECWDYSFVPPHLTLAKGFKWTVLRVLFPTVFINLIFYVEPAWSEYPTHTLAGCLFQGLPGSLPCSFYMLCSALYSHTRVVLYTITFFPDRNQVPCPTMCGNFVCRHDSHLMISTLI
jgi:hypothetical protein